MGHPRREDFDSAAEYEQAWWEWRAIERDGRLTNDELVAQWAVVTEFVLNRVETYQAYFEAGAVGYPVKFLLGMP
jgi:hypothetical protein